MDFSAKNQTIAMNQAEYKPALQWFVKYYLGKDLKGNNKRFLGFVLQFLTPILAISKWIVIINCYTLFPTLN